MMRQRSRAVVSVSLALLLAVPVTSAGTPTPLGAATPQALIERMGRAATDKNIGEIIACFDEASRHEITLGMVAATTMMVAFMGMGTDMAAGMAEGMTEATSGQKMKPQEKAKLEKGKAEAKAKGAKAKAGLSAVFKKHGLPDLLDEKATLPEKDQGAAMLKNVDEPALVNDLFQFMSTIGDPKDAAAAKENGPVPIPELGDVKNYKISGNKATAKAGAETIDFVKVGDRWFFRAPEKKKDEKKGTR